MGADRRAGLAARFARAAVCALALLAGAASARSQGTGWLADSAARDPAAETRPAPTRLDLQVRLKDVQVKHTPDGDRLCLSTDDGPVELAPADFSRALSTAQSELESSGFLYRIFNITKPWSFAWIAVGFAGQALFTFRMVLQWYVSEKEKRSVVPVAFWWGSLFGGILLFVYFVWRKDIVGIIGQSTGIFVYARNLVLIHRRTTPES